ncbi:MAG: tryptophan synthase subunit alpha [Fibromonadaceae bacterium]|jgi:tryptophan synthase alpha chain|nr:tryptophan synthase subunit alpha [Fibromonadaceae bacterium]
MANGNSGRIGNAFKNGKAFIAFLTAGDPDLKTTEELVLEMERAGADIIELGIPFSDPIAEGPVIQEADLRALASGTTPDKIFDMVKRIREKSQVPLVFLTYLNPVFKYGYDSFFAKCKEMGVDGIIIPDLPFEEQAEVYEFSSKHGINLVPLVAPTSEDRIKKIAGTAEGYLYVVSSLGVTGVRSEIKTDLKAIIGIAKETAKVPVAVGFGINTPEQAAKISQIADGIIVGSAIVKIIAEHGKNSAKPLGEYVRTMRSSLIN